MNIWATYGIGFAITGGNDGKPSLPEAMGLTGYGCLAAVLSNKGIACDYYDAEDAGGMTFEPFAGGEEKHVEPNEMFVIWAKKQPKPFEAAYPGGPDEIREEFRELLGEYLPKDFDWDAHIGFCNATVCN